MISLKILNTFVTFVNKHIKFRMTGYFTHPENKDFDPPPQGVRGNYPLIFLKYPLND